ncbi:MAG: DNA-3-methyladenine glycosylase 2 family protein [Gammaproteobacteria bacterium]|nr:DNA-3-methyladenine glycosylase 2 family protein [Gammaproteobacteria bacterium]
MTSAGTLKKQIDELCKSDHRLKLVLHQVGYPDPRTRPPGYATLLQIMVSQQLSTKAAAAIWSKLEVLQSGEVTAQKIHDTPSELLRSCGFSGRKIEYAKSLADGVEKGGLDLFFSEQETTNEIIESLCEIRGVGRWTAEIYAMFALDRGDIYPAKDLALQVAIQRYQELAYRPSEQEVSEIAMKWSPYQSAAALLMWKYYGAATLD